MTRVIGRLALLEEVRVLLQQGLPVALHGPAGIGKSALLDVLDDEVRLDATQRWVVLRAGGAQAEQRLPFAGLRDLWAQLPAELVAESADEMGEAVRDALACATPGRAADEVCSLLCATFHSLLATLTQSARVLLLIDEVQWLDPESACVVGYARRRLPDRVVLVSTVGPGEGDGNRIDVTGLHHLEVPPLDVGEMIDLLTEHGLSAHIAQRLHVESGGLPSLALALCGAIGERPSLLGDPTPTPGSIERVMSERWHAQPDDVRRTLLLAALMHRPTLRQLERAGRLDAEDDVRRAALSGLVVRDGGAVRFTPPFLRRVGVESTPASARAELHRLLAEVAASPAERLRHRALADPRPDAALALQLGSVARVTAEAGAREIAAELYLLAADRSPCELAPDRVEWLTAAVETAAPGNHAELVHRALGDFREAPATPAQAVRVRLALPELTGSEAAVLDEVLAAALDDAGDDDRLAAMVLLQRARVALMESRAVPAAQAAERAVELLERCDAPELAVGLAALAIARRWTGGDHRTPLARAGTLASQDRAAAAGFVHTSPAYVAARFALYDDCLEDAWAGSRALLAEVERGAGPDQVHMLRCLVEVAARTGRCREAMEYAARAARLGVECGLDAHTGWYISAVAELAGGDLARGATLARRGVVAAQECGDTRYLQRHLLLLGQALLRSGDAQGAHDALAQIRQIEQTQSIVDPTVNRWQPELVAALVRTGRLGEAGDLVATSRRALEGRSGTDGVSAQLDRAEAELLAARGQLDDATLLIERSIKVCADTGMRIELGRALMGRARLERRRRRAAAARAAMESARELFAELHALPWAEMASDDQPLGLPGRETPAGHPRALPLSDSEARIAQEVAAGASNREIAERTYLSVKTVEASLTRIYRKLGVRSRTQLATLLGTGGNRGR